MQKASDTELAQEAARVFYDQDTETVISAIARLAAATVIGGVCSRDRIHQMIDDLLSTVEN